MAQPTPAKTEPAQTAPVEDFMPASSNQPGKQLLAYVGMLPARAQETPEFLRNKASAVLAQLQG